MIIFGWATPRPRSGRRGLGLVDDARALAQLDALGGPQRDRGVVGGTGDEKIGRGGDHLVMGIGLEDAKKQLHACMRT